MIASIHTTPHCPTNHLKDNVLPGLVLRALVIVNFLKTHPQIRDYYTDSLIEKQQVTIPCVERNLALSPILHENALRKCSDTSCILRFSKRVFMQPQQNIKVLQDSCYLVKKLQQQQHGIMWSYPIIILKKICPHYLPNALLIRTGLKLISTNLFIISLP